MIGIGLGLIGVAVLVIAVIALRSPNGHGTTAGRVTTRQSSTPKPAPTPKSTAKSSPPKPATRTTHAAPVTHSSTAAVVKMPLVVLNNTKVTGLAALARTRFEAGGWTVTSTGNLVNNILSTCAYYDPGVTGSEASARALQAQFPAIKRVVAKFDGLSAGPIVVVLTSDYS